MSAEDKDTAFAELVRPYENQWVAIVELGGEEMIVGSGKDPAEALAEARTHGFEEALLFSVPSFAHSFIPKAVVSPYGPA
jgi:Family of unknown function (DUF5678)